MLGDASTMTTSTRWVSACWRAIPSRVVLFYTGLSEHGDPSVALREAQLGLRRNPRFHAPLYWAAYVLTTVRPGERIAIGATGRQ